MKARIFRTLDILAFSQKTIRSSLVVIITDQIQVTVWLSAISLVVSFAEFVIVH
ncbi:hypothetical protein G8759_27835 [Spirosoma aureum]|uniref:Uncharacterized protein n=1 Tax=Spirosoma aureum TaxID=2692134 RepID=A0A6G9AUW8_9BACT|nr:hypothetical protein [Spirosoma aureum]QIP16178.1 hypothetical protein G8759_27835 [Spirosoma aureum]